MAKTAFALYAILCIIMAVATFVENSYGTQFVHTYIYGSWWFILLWAVSLCLTLTSILKHFVWIKRLWNKIQNRHSTLFLLILLSLSASAKAPKCIKLEQAEQLKYQQVVYNERVCPLNTVALDFTQKITGKRSFMGLTAEQILISWSMHPEDWKNVRMIKVKKYLNLIG